MSTGTITSGLGHGALIVWLLLGDWLFSPPEPEKLTTISTSMVTEAEFAAMQAAAASTPAPAEVPAAEAPPEPVVETPPEPEVVEPPPEPEVVEPPPEPEVVQPPPEPEVVEPPPEPEVVPGPTAPDVDASDLPAAVELQPLQSNATSIRPRPRPAQVVSTTPTPSEEATPTDADPVEATAPAETPDPVEPQDPVEEVVPQDTGDVLATEATEDQTEPLGMTSSPRPPRKPPVPAATDVAADQPAEEPAEQPATETATDTAAIDEALAAALAAETTDSGTEDGGNTAPQGPPMTAGEKDGLRVAVNRCWNVGALSTEALRVTVTVYVDLDREGKPDSGSIKMATFEGGSEAAARSAFEVARRAIIRCAAQEGGFKLPAEKYEEWKELSLVFDPNGMRMR
jgi:hypothetical protein